MPGSNKAHTATANRIAKRYNAIYNDGEGIDIECDGLKIEVETPATIDVGIQRLKGCGGRAFVAVTNREGIADALRLTVGTNVGVMDPQGNIIKDSPGPDHPPG